MHKISKLSSKWIGNFGMTIGISDVEPSSSLEKTYQNEIK